MKFNHIISADMAKINFDAAFRGSDQQTQVKQYQNSVSGLSKFLKSLKELGCSPDSTLVCIEHTGHYIDLFTRILCGEGYFVWVVSPLVLRFFSADLLRLKSDKTDAIKLWNYAKSFQDLAQAFVPDSPQEEKLKDHERLRDQLVRLRATMLNMTQSNQDKAVPCQATNGIFEYLINEISDSIKSVEKVLENLIMKSKPYRRIYNILKSVPGLGPVLSRKIIILTRGFTRIKAYKAFACFVSISPFEKSSGKRKGRPRVSKMGHKKFKSNLFMGALRHIQPSGFFRQFYLYGTENQNKHHNSVMNALMNEIIKIAFHLVATDQLFDKEKYINAKQNKIKYLVLS